ncbi:GGDEF domain-containing protein [Catenuloplanes atrovinosus]|uniref:Diguanylate cyclase (GGDEF)-like protein n=1 Tax=Catenuloplanes atrovinosus TaxID=137266 RepID=A0AAE4C8V3_9ACTN|nr:GGDEF domain-containing protein [Catenuloplanes atrovinosus]MDR7274184.1 diguanylate cyclase (GGDEF)-like protein [Catenuloplanes atrovinosus]
MRNDRLPVPVSPYGPWPELALRVHDLTIRGHHTEGLHTADESEAILLLLGDQRTWRVARLGRMYALAALGRHDEALTIGEALIADTYYGGPRATDAKIMADTARAYISIARIDEGLHYIARAMSVLDTAPTGGPRYFSAMASLCEAAKYAELFELADEIMRRALGAPEAPELWRTSAELQHAELLLEWGVRLEQVDRIEDAALETGKAVVLLRKTTDRDIDSPLAFALLALGAAKQGDHAEAMGHVDRLLLSMRAAGQSHEARLLHLAHGIVLRDRGDLRGARREFQAGLELAVLASQRLLYRYELARLALRESPGEATASVFAALRLHVEALWRLRLDRRTMLRQAHRRVELEAARSRADAAASSDALTGLGNRRMFDRRMEHLSDVGSLLLIDVDEFKGINDRYSHGVGDRVLGEIAAVLRAHCRHDEVAIRFGGDEFAMFLSVGEREARVVAERIRQVILTRDWHQIAPGLRVTLSMGLAQCVAGDSGRDLYDRADARLYLAKRGGRNQLAAA